MVDFSFRQHIHGTCCGVLLPTVRCTHAPHVCLTAKAIVALECCALRTSGLVAVHAARSDNSGMNA